MHRDQENRPFHHVASLLSNLNLESCEVFYHSIVLYYQLIGRCGNIRKATLQVFLLLLYSGCLN